MGMRRELKTPSEDPAPALVPLTHLDLDEDPDTSLVTSLRLHLMSEHAVRGGLTMQLREAERMHARLHLAAEPGHSTRDLRFRPSRVLRSLAGPQRPVTPVTE